MNEVYDMSMTLHILFSKVLLFLLVLHLILVFIGDTSKFGYIKRLMFFLPTYYSVIAFIFFTGMLNLAIVHFSLSWQILVMIVCWILLIGFGAIGFKRLKNVRITKEFDKFKRFMAVKIFAEMILIVLSIVVGVMY